MARKQRKVFEVEIRGSSSPYNSNNADSNGDLTVVTDEIHVASWTHFDDVTFYVEDDHDVSFDVAIQSVDENNSNWSFAGDEGTITVESGNDGNQVHADGPLGKVRYRFESVGSAPTTGSIKVVAVGLGRD